MAIPALAVGLFAAGTALEFFGTLGQSEAQAQAAERDAAIGRMQAKETLERARLNRGALLREEARLIGSQVSQFAKAGIDVGSGASLDVMVDSIIENRRQIYVMQREAEFRAEVLMAGAASSEDLAGETRRAGQLQAFGNILTRGFMLGSASGKFDKNNGKTNSFG